MRGARLEEEARDVEDAAVFRAGGSNSRNELVDGHGPVEGGDLGVADETRSAARRTERAVQAPRGHVVRAIIQARRRSGLGAARPDRQGDQKDREESVRRAHECRYRTSKLRLIPDRLLFHRFSS